MRREIHKRGGVLLAALLMTGCAGVGAPPPASTVVVPASWQGTGVGAAGVTASPAATAGWWRRLGDETLASLVERALVGSPDVKSAQARVRAARAQRRLTGKDFLPSVDGSVSVSGSKTTGVSGDGATHERYSAGIDASWEPDLFGKTRSAVKAAQADLEATEADLEAARVTLAAEVARNYVDLRALQARLDVAKSNLATQEETLELTSWRAQAGLASDLDVEQARANVEQTRASVPSFETGIAEAEHALAVLLGLPPAALREELGAAGPIPAVPGTLAVGIPADTLRQRPDVRAAERRLVAATARVGQARAALYPSLRLSGSLSVEGLALAGLTSGETVVRSILAGLTAPLFDRARLRLQIDIQSAVEEQALAAWESATLTALAEVENALASLGGAQRRGKSLDAAVTAARSAARMARQRYAAGLVSYQVVLDTERSVRLLEDSWTSTEADGATALIRLYKALGGGWDTARETTADTTSDTKGENS